MTPPVASPIASGVTRMPCDGQWAAEPGLGVYLHIPFCKHRCHYCDFNTYEGLDALHDAYVDALIRTIEAAPSDRPAGSVFFGGGTPTLLGSDRLSRILEAVRTHIGVDEGAEVTVEANPETVDARYFHALAQAGVSRVSIGVQSLAPHVLAGLGRTHPAARALEAIAEAQSVGGLEVNADLIYGSPWERPQDWGRTLEGVVALDVDHVSAYALTIEESTPLATLVRTGRVADVDPDTQADRHAVAEEILGAAGYVRYEVSNWSRPGRASTHNVCYWSAGDYLGLGAGAHGHLDGRRYWNLRLPRDFIAAAEAGDVEAGSEIVDDRASEALMLGLRLSTGIDMRAFERRFGSESISQRADVIEELMTRGLLIRDDERLWVAPEATLLGDEVARALI
jgi:putative oxygen-independent coproporphyrinogen III oxidase